jgi:hypothetical protein
MTLSRRTYAPFRLVLSHSCALGRSTVELTHTKFLAITASLPYKCVDQAWRIVYPLDSHVLLLKSR